ncbi:GH3 auxin-responsive promoter family protein [Lutibacter sp. B1]|uniref:GH3 family domain-containing protein n=1 Tax=Lutibacter sp. B1 TaxID=2725996 RepID=UPI00145745CB|nr:GH3 auxin-responsive promoter family protein [Lutibacter sp. B1]NLP58660.1 GH3 auxin-responsive promoter family protein [Lutibacter sp. B1]
MAILGSIIKGIIDIRDTFSSRIDHEVTQVEMLRNLLSLAKDTQFGNYYNFEEILNSENIEETFRKKIPYFDYKKINEEWWYKLHKGETNITWPGKPTYFALSSGTTGKKSKRIPITDEMVKSIKDTGIKQIFTLSNFELSSDFFEKEILMLGSSTNLNESGNFLEGEISGISANNIPYWFKGYYKPGDDIAQIDDWDQRVNQIVKRAKNWDIGAISGIPSWIEIVLQKIISFYNLKNIHEIWPNFQVYTSGGVAFESYQKSFNALLGKPITVIDTYLASEGFLAFQTRPETSSMKLVTDKGIYFEFVPFKPEYIKEDGSIIQDAPSLKLSEVEENQEYILIISTVTGAWRYLIGDTIRFTDIDKIEIKITGRTKFFLNTVGSQLSVEKLNDAIQFLEEKFDVKIPEYVLSAKRIDGDFYHCWYLGIESEINTQQIEESLDSFLKDANKNYNVARNKALKGIKVKLITLDIFYQWNEKNKKKGGQVKMERVMNEDTFKKWEKFTDKKLSKINF